VVWRTVYASELQYVSGGSEIPEETNCEFAEDQQVAVNLCCSHSYDTAPLC